MIARRNIVVVLLTSVVVLMPRFGFATKSNGPVILSEGWALRWGETGVWEPVGKLDVLPRSGPEDFFWLRHTLPEGNWRDPALLIGIFRPFEAYLNDASLYRAGEMAWAYMNKFEGIQKHLIYLPIDAGGCELQFRVYAGELKFATPKFRVVIGNRADLMRYLQREWDRGILGCILLLIGLIGGYIYLRRREAIALSFGGLSFCVGLYSVAGVDFVQQLFPFPVVHWYLFFCGLFFFPVCLWAFWDEIFDSSRLAIFLRLWQCHLIFALICLVLDLLGELPFSESVPFFLYVMSGEMAILVLVLLHHLRSAKAVSTEVRILSAGSVGLALFGLHDILRGLQILPSEFFVFHWGLFLFILLLGYLLERRFSEAHRQLEVYSHELEETNRTLELRIAERTQDLADKNEQLEATLRDLQDAQN